MTLTVIAAASSAGQIGTDWVCAVTANINGTSSTIMSVSANTAQTTYTLNIPASTVLSSISIEATASAGSPSSGAQRTVTLNIYEVDIQS